MRSRSSSPREAARPSGAQASDEVGIVRAIGRPTARAFRRLADHPGHAVSIACAGALLLAACTGPSGTEPPWIYGLSRGLYSTEPTEYQPGGQSANNVGMLAILVLPFALDTVLLPITVPHDLCCVD